MGARRRTVVLQNICYSNQCAAKVKLASKKTGNKQLAWEAMGHLRERDGFRNVFLSNPWGIHAKPLNGKKDYWEVYFNYTRSNERPSDRD